MRYEPVFVIPVGVLVAALSAGLASGQLKDKRPPQVPPGAAVQTAENLKDFEDVVEREIDVSIARKHVALARVGETVEVTLELNNADAESVMLTVTEMHRPGLDYLDGLEIRTLRYESQSIPFYSWEIDVPANSIRELKYRIRKESPGIVDFYMALASGPYGNQFESPATSLTVVCDPDGLCGPDESSLFCPEDCTTGLEDGNCDAIEDGVNDPDCAYGIDPDYDPDADSDGDGVPDDRDVCPGYPEVDRDGDGRPDDCDTCPLDGEDDLDNDGVCGDQDKCPGTTAEEPSEPVIYGCSCKQILDLKPGKNEGERKHGCSPGTIKNFIEGKGPFKPPKPKGK